MRKALSVVIGCGLSIASALFSQAAEPTWEYSVQVSATAQASPAQITLSWPQDAVVAPTSYTVYRKAPGATSWGAGTSLPGTATGYTDTSVAVGAVYEYQVAKVTSTYNGYGYIQAGINAPLASLIVP